MAKIRLEHDKVPRLESAMPRDINSAKFQKFVFAFGKYLPAPMQELRRTAKVFNERASYL